MDKRDVVPAKLLSGKRGFLKGLLGLSATATVIPIAPVHAAIGTQPPRRPGMAGKRYGMLVDLRKCIGCQACTVSCSVENLPPLGQFRTTVLQYEVDFKGHPAPSAMVNSVRSPTSTFTLASQVEAASGADLRRSRRMET